MEFQTLRIPFPPAAGMQLRQVAVRQAFRRPIASAAVALTGYSLRLKGDRELKDLIIRLEHTIFNSSTTIQPEVRVVATLGVRDAAGYFDDPFEGEIEALLIYELVPSLDSHGRLGDPLLETLDARPA